MGKLIFVSNEMPPCNSSFMERLAKHFWEMKQHYHDARRPLETKWRMCDEAYLCYRWLPDTGSIDFLDDSEFGDTDGFDNVNSIVVRMLQAILPPNYPYLNPAAVDEDEPQDTTDSLRDFLIFKHRESRSRRQLAKWLKMMTVRGDGGFYWEHQEEYVHLPVAKAKEQAMIFDALKTGKIASEEAAKFVKVMEKHCRFNGPVIRVIDTHDYFFSPCTDLTNKRKEPYIVQTYRYIDDLNNEVDQFNRPVYENLKGLEPMQAFDLWGRMNDGAARVRSLQIMGMQPEAQEGYTKLVPVYVVYCPYLEFEGKKFYDTYFHFAVSAKGKGLGQNPRMIRVEQNPANGHPQFLFDTYNEFFTNAPYGISGLEKSLTALRQKNVLSALLFNAAVSAQFPAQNVVADAFKDGEVSFMPGAINELANIGANPLLVMAPVPTPDRGLQLGWQDVRFWGDEIRTKMGIDGLSAESATRSVTKAKTATEVNRDSGSGNLFLDEMAAKYSDTLTEFFQGSFDVMQDRIEPDEEGYLSYQRNVTGRLIQSKLAHSDFTKPRSITVAGSQGIFDKGQRLQAITQALDMVSRAAPFLPNAPQVINDLTREALRLMNVPVSQKAFMSQEELAAQNPQVQIMALQKAMQQIGQAAQQGQIPQIPMNHGGDIVDAQEVHAR